MQMDKSKERMLAEQIQALEKNAGRNVSLFLVSAAAQQLITTGLASTRLEALQTILEWENQITEFKKTKGNL